MRHILSLISLSFTLLIFFGCSVYKVDKPKELKILGDYKHSKTGIHFPNNFENYKRKSITSLNSDSSYIRVSYFLDNLNQDPHVTVYIYPAPNAIESRLRDEYFNCLQSLANVTSHGIDVKQRTTKLTKYGYNLTGISASINHENVKTVLTLFECGKYFIKYRISSKSADTTILNDLSTKVIEMFSPFDIVKKHPLLQGVTIHVAPGIVPDQSCRRSIVAAAIGKTKWVHENVDSLEKCSGFPSLYFEEQKAAIDSMLNKWASVDHNNTKDDFFFNDLLQIRNSGYLNEYIYDQYKGILVLPDRLKLDFENYEKWKQKNNPTVSLVGPILYYYVGYEKSYENEQ